jgi:hypothetical protein
MKHFLAGSVFIADVAGLNPTLPCGTNARQACARNRTNLEKLSHEALQIRLERVMSTMATQHRGCAAQWKRVFDRFVPGVAFST